MNLKHLFLTTAIVAIIFSCKKSDPEPTIKNEEDLEVVNSTSFEKIEMKVSQEIKAEPYFMVGYGYDAKENLLFVNKGLRAKILDTKKLSEADKISKMKGASSGGTFIEDLSKSRLLHNLMLNSNFNMEKLTTTETEVLSNIPESDRDIQLKHYYTDNFYYRTYQSEAENPEFQHEEFVNFVKTNSPADIVKKYGTHLILTCSKWASVKLIKYLHKKTELEDKVLKDWKTLAFVLGGDLSQFNFDPITNNIDVGAWLGTTTEQNGDFISFGSDSPIPLYELISDKSKKFELKNYIDNYLGIKKGS